LNLARQTLQTVAATLSNMDGNISEPERRRTTVLGFPIHRSFQKLRREFAIRAPIRRSEKNLTTILKELDAMVDSNR